MLRWFFNNQNLIYKAYRRHKYDIQNSKSRIMLLQEKQKVTFTIY